MKRKYVVFDWDGTLADTYPVIWAAYDYAFQKLSLPPLSHDEIKRIISARPNKGILEYIFGNRAKEAAGHYYEYIEKYHTEKLAPMKGAADLLDFCRDNGLACFLLTNKKTKFIRKELEKLGFAKYFKKVVAAGECPQDKPHPAACLAVFENGLPPADEIAVIGDGEADVKVAGAYRQNGRQAASIIYDPAQKYCGEKADYVIKNLPEAIKILEEEI